MALEPSELEALNNLPEKQILLLTYGMVHELHEEVTKNVKPRIRALERWQVGVVSTVSGITAFIMLGHGTIKEALGGFFH